MSTTPSTINKMIQDLSDIKNSILSNSGEGVANNSTELQVALDLITNMPLKNPITISEMYDIYQNSLYYQEFYTEGNGVFTPSQIVRITGDIRNDNGTIKIPKYSKNMTDKFLLSSSVPVLKHELHSASISSSNSIYKNNGDSNENILCISNIERIKSAISEMNTDFSNKEAMQFWYNTDPKLVYNLSPLNNTVLQLGGKSFNHNILYDKENRKFKVTSTIDNSVLYQTSEPVYLDSYEIGDIIIYSNRIVVISKGKLNDLCKYKVYSLPELNLVNDDLGRKLDVYNTLALTRRNIIGPNAYPLNPFLKDISNYKKCSVIYGFRLIADNLYDIYMNSIRDSEDAHLRYIPVNVNNDFNLTKSFIYY